MFECSNLDCGIYASICFTFYHFTAAANITKFSIFKNKEKKRCNNYDKRDGEKNVGKKCHISTGSFGISIIREIVEVNERWIEVRTKKGNQLIKSEFIQNIKIKSN